jgi:hypothetical protein
MAPSPHHHLPIQLQVGLGSEVTVVPKQRELAAHRLAGLLEALWNRASTAGQ